LGVDEERGKGDAAVFVALGDELRVVLRNMEVAMRPIY